MRGLNKIVIVGRLGRDPEVMQGKNGTRWCTLSVATNRSRREGEGWVEATDWHDVRVFGDAVARCERRLRTGSVVAVDGQLHYEPWTDDYHQRRRQPRIVTSRIQFVSDLKPVGPPSAEGAVPEAEDTVPLPS